MKIVCVDNYDREIYDDVLVCDNVNDYYGKQIVEFLNDKAGEDNNNYYRLVGNDYELFKFEP